MVRYAMKRGLAGFLVDGAMRDVGVLKNLDFPIYAKGVTPKGPYKDGPGEINVPVVCGGVLINPGDIIVGDEDGVVVISPEQAPEVLIKAKETVEKEAKILESIEAGTFDRSWVDETLFKKGCEIVNSKFKK